MKNGHSFNSKFEGYMKWNLKSKSPCVSGKNYGLFNIFNFSSNRYIKNWVDEQFFQDFPENSTFEIEGSLKTNKPLLFSAKPMDLKLIKGK